MSSRMNKYYDDNEQLVRTRFSKNEELYKEISKSEIDNYEIKSNTTVLGENKNEIDVEKIKKILDTKYNETPKRRSIRIEDQPEEVEQEKEITKEYDINAFLEKAKEQKTDNYEEERLKKLRDTQFDILKNLNVDKTDKEEIDPEENLKELINTIAINESKRKKINSNKTSLDIFSELMGGEDTEVLEGLKEEVSEKELENTDNLEQSMTNTIVDIKDNDDNNSKTTNITDTKMINSFYTSSNAINEKDFEDMDDFSKSIESGNIFLKIVIGIIVIVFIGGIILLIKTFFLT